MSVISLRGYDVSFPYPIPYDIQKSYMNKVLTCLDEKTHAVLESPTGTGKTLCLFAPVTAWAKRKKNAVVHVTQDSNKELNSPYFESSEHQGPWGVKSKSKVWYTARTHSQIAQTVSEVRKCDIEGLHVRVMGARDQLCINELVLEEKDSYIKTVKCKELVKTKKCKYFTKLSYEKDFKRFYQSGEVLDIEDLVSIGKSCGICPYFLAKRASESADIILLPYNYIIDRESRESNGLQLQNDVIIFDEGHNVPSTCEESYEFSFTSLDIAIGIKNIQDVMLSLSKLTEDLIEDEEIDVSKHVSNSIMMVEMLQKLESALSELNASNELLPVSELYNFLSSAGINENKSRILIDGISSFKNDSEKLSLTGSVLETFNLLEKMMSVMYGSTVRSFEKSVVDRSFKCVITTDPERHFAKKFSLYCFNPSFGIKSLLALGSQSIIITSGTLSPLRTFIYELGLPKPVTLENKHIAKKCQVPFIILGTGVNNVKMDGAYKNRNDPKYVLSLGMSLTNLIASIPDGILLLFSSYTMMQSLKESWEKDLGIWTRLNSLKRVFVEPRNKNEFINCMENYRRAIDSGNGAILMGVLRGKISEGMDFKDQYCRGVFIIGVPFPPVQDIRVIGKQKYSESLMIYNEKTNTEEKLYNQPYLSIEAMKATNQAIGRVIRHGKDYGVIILVDYRFAWPRLFFNISSWLRDNAPTESNFPTAKKLISDFFRNIHAGELGVEEIHCQPLDGNGCPIAKKFSYEEYDHKKQPPRTGPRMDLSGIEAKSATSSGTQINKERWNSKSRGHSKIKYTDDDLTPQNLLSKYKSDKKNFDNAGSATKKAATSLSDAIELARKNLENYSSRENLNEVHGVENNKRKFSDDEEESFKKNSCPKLSPSLFSSPESSQGSQPKKYSHIKVKPLLPASENDGDVIAENKHGKANENYEKDLKEKLINYYSSVKTFLSVNENFKFKLDSSNYMRGEISLTEMISTMDEVFLKAGNKNLYAGFRICIKPKDKMEWSAACKKRGIKNF